ncbi:DUF2971 domain-containing protein [Pseudovibrio flavus]|uniref:DUF2971 domain-containing protein n=1 Tax=Pseudovibrio flavus TaxID=2529854 RepID=UPI00211C1F0D|nr:DUF2971 domain-containing protein [Pseudovibrio flavus]
METAKKVLSSGQLRWSSPALFNDVADIQFGAPVSVVAEELKSIVEKRLHALYSNAHLSSTVAPEITRLMRRVKMQYPKLSFEEFCDISSNSIEYICKLAELEFSECKVKIEKHLKTLKVLCLTDAPDLPNMWGYYGDSHRGVVMEFASDRKDNSHWNKAIAVNYVDRLETKLGAHAALEAALGNRLVDGLLMKSYCALTKHKSWEHERERRFVDQTNVTDDYVDLPFNPNELVGIYSGFRVDQDQDFSTLLQRYPKARLYRMEMQKMSLKPVPQETTSDHIKNALQSA